MRLQRHLTRKLKGKEYAKWILTVPPEEVEKLKWKEGEILNTEITTEGLLVKKTYDLSYTEFKSKLTELLNARESGFTWQEIRKKLNMEQTVPNNKWVTQLENEIGLKRRKEGATTYWYLEKKGVTIFTIGYEGKKLQELIQILKEHQIGCLIDVRELALSRKNGYSKSALSTALKEKGIVYRHFQELGSPRELRHKLWNEGNYEEFFENYSKWLSSPQAKEYLTDLEGLAHVRPTVIMCFEKDITKCHRSIIKKRLIEDGFKVIDL